ncbi:MAG: GNAT family N-acetyltransferase [Acidimicrobiales bacterium]|nr:GNAT family N-acetyltransferase [Acidimicrobiales bacterium]
MLRPYQPEDLTALLEAWMAASRVAHPFLDDAFLEREQRMIGEVFLPASDATVAVVDDRVVGFISLLDNEVGGLFVHPDHQGDGHGRALMDHARASRPFLELEVFEANAIGRRFYDRYGFSEVGRGADTDAGFPVLRLRLE